jgi:L-threonylcarbamoyladenylate synthase
MTDEIVHETRLLPFGQAALEQAAELIRAGQTVAVATETVYGLAADATHGEAVARIYAAKGRPRFNPLIVHAATLEAAAEIVALDPLALSIAERFWPGPLTLVLPRRPSAGIAALASAGLPTLAVRVPAHPAMQALLEASGRPLAAPSANASGRISPTRADHVLSSLEGRIPLILDSGPTEIGLESTIIGVRDGKVRLLRHGPIGEADIGIALEAAGQGVEAPGQLASHYAPRAPLRLGVTTRDDDQWLIGFGEVRGDATLSASGDLVEAAATLFDRLHQADVQGRAAIAVAPIPRVGLGLAINDRLLRAAAPGMRLA